MPFTRENQYWFFGNKKNSKSKYEMEFLALESKSLLIAFF
jgi:hypothetical protein